MIITGNLGSVQVIKRLVRAAFRQSRWAFVLSKCADLAELHLRAMFHRRRPDTVIARVSLCG